MAPASDDKLGEGCAVLGADDSKECVQGSGVVEREDIIGVEDRLCFGIDGPIEKEDIGIEGASVVGGPALDGAAVTFGFGGKIYDTSIVESYIVDLVLEFRWEGGKGEDLALGQRLG